MRLLVLTNDSACWTSTFCGSVIKKCLLACLFCFSLNLHFFATFLSLIIVKCSALHSEESSYHNVSVTASECPSLSFTNADSNTTLSLFKTYVNVSCHSGYQFTAGTYWIISQCQSSRQWFPQLTDCSGYLSFSLLHIGLSGEKQL